MAAGYWNCSRDRWFIATASLIRSSRRDRRFDNIQKLSCTPVACKVFLTILVSGDAIPSE